MPRSTHRYRKHSSGNAFVEIDKRRIYLGRFGSQESLDAYKRVLDEHRINQEAAVVASHRAPGSSMTVVELVDIYRQHCANHYRKNGELTSEVHIVRAAMLHVLKLFTGLSVYQFGPLCIEAIQESMMDAGCSRTTINGYVIRIRRMFRWAVAKQYVPEPIYRAVATAPGLGKGRTRAKEAKKVRPVSLETVTATLRYLRPQVQAMVWAQWYSAMRPAEVCNLRPMDVSFDTGTGCYRYDPSTFKTEHHEDSHRIIAIGPQCYEILKPYLDRAPDAYCFDPREVISDWQADKRRRAVKPARRSRAIPGRKRPPSDRYTPNSYRKTIVRACRRMAIDNLIAKGMTRAEAIEEVKKGFESWAPNRLRHAAATRIRAKYGLEASQHCLGHTKSKMTLNYAEKHFRDAASVMLDIG